MNVERTCIFCSLLNKQLSLMGLFLCLSLISLGRYCIENVFKYVCVCVCVCGGGGGGLKPSAHHGESE